MSEEKKALIKKVQKMTAVIGAMTRLKETKPTPKRPKAKP